MICTTVSVGAVTGAVGIYTPPNGIQRKCIDVNTIAVWNQVAGKYDTASCGAGKVCKDGYCVASESQAETGEVFIETYRGYTIKKQVFSSGAMAFYVYLNGIDQYGNLRTLAEARAYVDILVAKPPPIVDKYYDCVSGKCIEKVGGQYKNDPKCGGKCAPPGNNTGTYLLLGAIALGVMMFMKKRR